ASDREVLREIARFAVRHTALGARYGLVQMVHELEMSLNQELDFRLEAENTRRIGRQIAGFGKLCTPTVYPQYTSQRVLTLSFLRGRHLADFSREELKELDPSSIAAELLSAYMKQIAIDGVFHCDPHPGNIMLTDAGVLSPELDPVELIRNYMLDVMLKRVADQLSPGRVFAWVLDMKHLFENAPRRTDIILGKLADDRLTVRLDVSHLDDSTRALSRAATRLAYGVVAGSLLIGGGQ